MSERGRVILAVALAFVAAACAGGEDTLTTETSPEDSSSTEPVATDSTMPSTSSIAVTAAPTPGEWTVSTVPIVTEGIATQSDMPVQPPEIHALGRLSGGWFAIGAVNGGFTVWRSSDLSSFEPVHAEVCCQRSVRATAVAELDGTLLIGGTEYSPDAPARAFIDRSDDGGATWSAVKAALSTAPLTRVDRMVTTADTVIVEAVDDSGSAAGWTSTIAWTDDLATWTPVELPGALDTDWPTLVHDGTVVYAVVSRSLEDGTFVGWAIWRSDDGGRSFTEMPTLTDPGLAPFLVVAGSLVAIPSLLQAEYVHADAVGPAVLGADGTWVRFPPDTGTWGDGRVSASIAAVGSGAPPVFLITRELRASAHYCYADVASCQQYESALVTSPDGSAWAELADVPGIEPLALSGGNALTVRSDPDGIVVAWAASGESSIHVTRWTSGAMPPSVERHDYPPPEIPVPLYDGTQEVGVGAELRYVLGLGGCGGLYIGGQPWEPESPLPDRPPPEWPYRAVQIADGPAGYLYGRILRTADDSIEFSIEGVGPVATFHPAPPPEYMCG